jgi:hypothetical protein
MKKEAGTLMLKLEDYTEALMGFSKEYQTRESVEGL